MAVRGDRLRAAGLTGAAIRLTAIAIPLIAICAGIGALIAAAVSRAAAPVRPGARSRSPRTAMHLPGSRVRPARHDDGL